MGWLLWSGSGYRGGEVVEWSVNGGVMVMREVGDVVVRMGVLVRCCVVLVLEWCVFFGLRLGGWGGWLEGGNIDRVR